MFKKTKSFIKSCLAARGWELNRLSKQQQVICDNPYESLLRGSSLVNVQMHDCIDKLGFNYGDWQPWTETVKQIIDSRPHTMDYESSISRLYYQRFSSPILNDVFSEQISDEKLRNHFLKVFHGYFLPFCDGFPGSLDEKVSGSTRYLQSDNLNAGYSLTVDQSINLDGTWSDEKGKIEIERLSNLVDSIETKGYARTHNADGDIQAYVLEKDGKFKFVIVSGLHRMAVLAALGHESVTLRLFRNVIVNSTAVSVWPLVKQGIYTPQSALAYFKHLFDFDSSHWAQNHLQGERQK